MASFLIKFLFNVTMSEKIPVNTSDGDVDGSWNTHDPQVLRPFVAGGTLTLAWPVGHEPLRVTREPPLGVPHHSSCGETIEISRPRGYGLNYLCP